MLEVTTYRIIEDIGGYYLSDARLGYADCRGTAHPSRRAAIAALRCEVEQSGEPMRYLSPAGRAVSIKLG